MSENYAVEFLNITKDFAGIKANDDITFKIKKGSIHALVGENGAGKSTLMSILFGLYEQTKGKIKVFNKEVFFKNPFEANNAGIGMVHQHFKLVDVYTNLENIILGFESENKFKILDKKIAADKIRQLQKVYNLNFDLNQKTGEANVATQQKVEIMKMLYRNAEILIFDEPTAVLNDEEIQGLLKTMLLFKKNGKTIIFISHKLNEIKKVCDEATVIRLGKVVKKFDTLENSKVEDIAIAMVGKSVNMPKNNFENKKEKIVLEFQNVSYGSNKKLKDISFKIHQGEILAIAGVEGNGQEEIEFLTTGLLKTKKGKILKTNYSNSNVETIDITNKSVRNKIKQNISYIPGDRHKYGLVLDFNMNNNSILRRLYTKGTSIFGLINNKSRNLFSKKIIEDFNVRGSREGMSLSRSLSGGNQQKFIVGREILSDGDLIVVVQPTRGLDVGAINLIHDKILQEKQKGKAILLISYELDEVLSLADTILVLNKGKIAGYGNKKEITREKIGLMMAGMHNEKEKAKING